MPLLNWPNRITVARIVLIAPFIICLLNLNAGWSGWRYIAIVLFVVTATSDALDGFLARRLQEETTLGRYLDPLADKLLIASGVILLASKATAVPDFQLPSWVAVIVVGKDLLTVIGFGLIYITTGKFLAEPKISGKTCTVVQLILLGYVLVGPDLPHFLQGLLPFLYWLVSGFTVVTIVVYFLVGSRFAAPHSSRHK